MSSSPVVPKASSAATTATLQPEAAATVTPVVPVVPVAGSTPVALTAASPSVSTTAPTSSVSVTVPNVTGTVTFSLVVTDNLGVSSAPAYATVTIQAPPKAALAATPATVTEGGTIQLSGAGSTTTGSIANFKFSLVPQASTSPVAG
jgi:hypothetical protein